MRPEPKHSFVAGKVRRRNVAVLGVTFMHGLAALIKLRYRFTHCEGLLMPLDAVVCVRDSMYLIYSSRPGRAMRSRMASLGLLL
jgi:hypothetical protein